MAQVEAEIENMTRSWPQKVEALIEDRHRTVELTLPHDHIDWMTWARAFPAGYQERYGVAEAIVDTSYLANLTDQAPVNLRAYQAPAGAANEFAFKLYTRGDHAIPLSDVLPVLDNMGLRTLEEYGYNVRSPETGLPVGA